MICSIALLYSTSKLVHSQHLRRCHICAYRTFQINKQSLRTKGRKKSNYNLYVPANGKACNTLSNVKKH